jgi:MFS transporter, DHA1 family, tetracycline resistance protein
MEENQIVKKTALFVYIPLILTIIIDTLGMGIVYPVFASIFNNTSTGILPAGISITTGNLLYGITLASFSVGMFIGAPLLGDLSDHWGRKKVLLLCLFGEGIGMWVCAAAISYKFISLIILSRFFTGLLAGSFGIAQAAVIDISPEHKKTVSLSLISIAAGVGFAIGPIIGSYFVISPFFGQFGYSGPFVFAGLLALLNGYLLMITFKETFRFMKPSKIDLNKGYKLFISGLTNEKLKYPAIALLLIQISWVIYFLASSLFMVKVFKFDISRLGYFVSFIAAVYGFTLIVIIRILVKVFDTKSILLWSCILLGCGMMLASIKTEFISWLAIIPIAMGAGLAYLAVITLFSDAASKDSQGWAMGVAASVSAVAACFASVLSGILPSFSFTLTYVIAAVFAFMAAFVIKKRI